MRRDMHSRDMLSQKNSSHFFTIGGCVLLARLLLFPPLRHYHVELLAPRDGKPVLSPHVVHAIDERAERLDLRNRKDLHALACVSMWMVCNREREGERDGEIERDEMNASRSLTQPKPTASYSLRKTSMFVTTSPLGRMAWILPMATSY